MLLAVTGIAALAALAGCSLGGAGTAAVQLAPRAVQTEPVQKVRIGDPIEQVAEVMAGTKLDIVPKAGGEVKQVFKKRGEAVEKDEVLLTLDSAAAESALRKSELAVRNAEEALRQAKDNRESTRRELEDGVKRAEVAYTNAQEAYNKMRNDYDAGLVQQRQVDQSKQAADDALLSLEAAKRKRNDFEKSDPVSSAETQAESARLSLDDAVRAMQDFSVKAPGRGILTDFEIVPGQSVSAAAGAIGQVQQVDPVKIKTELSESRYRLVKGKQELVFYDPDTPTRKGTAKIGYLAPIMSPSTKTFTLELELPNPDLRLQPGKRFMIQLTTEQEEEVLAVPIVSVIREESETFLFVREGDQYRKRNVRLGRISGEYQEVLEGLKEGELAVVAGQYGLQDGQKAENVPAPAAAPAAP
ncbi:efflux RND transporter periplasmic adaptor subunit [Paenibacillus flagellatus]|uniref:Efflux RND transporter periplasmic adaptor subunit n=2 Tax=Paenibacillus flagellatus TaxID=2211139 RepID=A0A2V5K3X9_9BACL|nr:efflux RND transporter periplasmic adaptor subunit [Paenibacillus flagellatus]